MEYRNDQHIWKGRKDLNSKLIFKKKIGLASTQLNTKKGEESLTFQSIFDHKPTLESEGDPEEQSEVQMLWENKTAKWLGRSHRHADCHRCGCGGGIIWKVLVLPTSDENDREEFCTDSVCLEGRLQVLFFSCHKCKIGKINNQFYFWDSFTVLHKGNFSTAWKELLTQRLLRHVNLSFSKTHTSWNCGTDSTLCGVL